MGIWKKDSLEIAPLDKRKAIISKASNQDGNLDLDSHLHVLFLRRHCKIGRSRSASLPSTSRHFGWKFDLIAAAI
jgi:hypothetical protein